MYAVSPWRTVGGVSGKYELESPPDMPMEFMLDQVSANVPTTVVIGFDANDDLAAIIAGYAASSIPTPGWRGMVLRLGANIPFTGNGIPFPLWTRRVYVQILTDSAGACYVTAHFRWVPPQADDYMRSAQNMAATIDIVKDDLTQREAIGQWASNLAADNNSALAQSSRPEQDSQLRRSNSHRKRPGILSR